MPRYISLSEYGTGNSRKNMRNYGNDYMQSYQNYHKFMEYLRNLETYKEEFKGKIPYFWGMRKNWFPLILLGAVKEGNQEALNLFNKMVKDRSCHSFYYKYRQIAPEEPFGLGGGDYDLIVVSGLECDNKHIDTIMKFFGLKYYLYNNTDGLYADGGF